MRKVLVGFPLILALAFGCGGSEPQTGAGNDPRVLPPMMSPPAGIMGAAGLGAPKPTTSTSGPTAGAAPSGMAGTPGTVMGGPTAGAPAAGAPAAGAPAAAGSDGAMAGAAPGTGGMAGAAQPPMGGSTAMPAPMGNMDPVVPMLTADCPEFRNGTITFMNLGGITISAGAKPAGPTAPMVFYWHGTGSTAGEYAFMATAVNSGVVAEGGVLVSFQGTTGGDFSSGTAIFGKGDWDLADQLFACAVKNHNVDPRRVFTMGCSAGGLFSTAMAAARSSYIAAAAPNSGGWSFPAAFQNAHVPALMTVHGAAGVDVVGLDFSVSSAQADKDFKAKGGFVINCDHGGNHCGGGGLAPDVWEFFKAHPFGVSPEPWAGGLPSGFSSQCKIF